MSSIAKIMKEPLLHFLLIGLALFAAFRIVDESPPSVGQDEIIITEAEAETLAAGFAKVWRRPPDADELASLIEDRVREEVFVREATALGMDQNDTVVRRRLRQKMEFLTASVVEAIEPDDTVLVEFYNSENERFRRSGQVAFKQVFLGEKPSDADIAASLEILRSGGNPDEMGVRSLIPSDLPLSRAVSVDGTFGRGFFDRLAGFPAGEWSGPVASGYGVHLVLVTSRQDPVLPPFEAVREQVVQEWRTATKSELLDKQYQKLRLRYQVTVPRTNSVRRDAQR